MTSVNLYRYQLRELSRTKLFGRPGHGAPTENIKKKKFTEYQLEKIDKEMHGYNPYGDSEYDFGGGEGATAVARPPPDYRTTAEPPRPQTYDSYEKTRPSPNCQEYNPVSQFSAVLRDLNYIWLIF